MAQSTDGSASSGQSSLVEELFAQAPALLARLGDTDEIGLRIIAAARSQIEAVGWRRTTMDDIAKRARLGRATVYRKFPTKREILELVVAAEIQNYYQARATVGTMSTVEDRIAESAVFTVQYLRNNSMLTRLLESEPEAILPALTRDAASIFRVVAELAIPIWQREIDGDAPLSDERLQHYRTVAELHARITLSFILTRESSVPLNSPDQIRQFARDYLAPLLLRTESD